MSSVRASGRGRSWRVLLWATVAVEARWACAHKRRTSATFAGRTWCRLLSLAAAPKPLSPLHATGLQLLLCHHLHAKKFSQMRQNSSLTSTCTMFMVTASQALAPVPFTRCRTHSLKLACVQNLTHRPCIITLAHPQVAALSLMLPFAPPPKSLLSPSHAPPVSMEDLTPASTRARPAPTSTARTSKVPRPPAPCYRSTLTAHSISRHSRARSWLLLVRLQVKRVAVRVVSG